jgi:hypothetical protein
MNCNEKVINLYVQADKFVSYIKRLYHELPHEEKNQHERVYILALKGLLTLSEAIEFERLGAKLMARGLTLGLLRDDEWGYLMTFKSLINGCIHVNETLPQKLNVPEFEEEQTILPLHMSAVKQIFNDRPEIKKGITSHPYASEVNQNCNKITLNMQERAKEDQEIAFSDNNDLEPKFSEKRDSEVTTTTNNDSGKPLVNHIDCNKSLNNETKYLENSENNTVLKNEKSDQTLKNLCDALSTYDFEKLNRVNINDISTLYNENMSVLTSIVFPKRQFNDKKSRYQLKILIEKLNSLQYCKKFDIEDRCAKTALTFLFDARFADINVDENIELISQLFTQPQKVDDYIDAYIAGELPDIEYGIKK